MSRRRTKRRAQTTDARPPEARLEAMAREPSRDRAHRMIQRIREDLDANPEPAPWLAAARTLWERLIISEDSWHYLADMFTECLIYHGSSEDPELVRIREEMDAIEAAHGLREDEAWRVDQGPDDWRALNEAWDRRADEIVNVYLRDSGHADVAELREGDLDDFHGRAAKGRTDLFGRDQDSDLDY